MIAKEGKKNTGNILQEMIMMKKDDTGIMMKKDDTGNMMMIATENHGNISEILNMKGKLISDWEDQIYEMSQR